MGFFDIFTDTFDSIADSATEAINQIAEVASDIQQKVRDEIEGAISEAMAADVFSGITKRADNMIKDIEKLLPSFEERLNNVVDEITELASDAAGEGVDITDAINAAVEVAFQKVESAKTTAIRAVQAFIQNAQRELLDLLVSILPEFCRPLLDYLKDKVGSLVDNIVSTGARLIDSGISAALQTIKVFVKDLVRKVGEVLGPIWKFIKQLWNLLFGVPPEQCEITIQWFEERMNLTERQLLPNSHKQSTAPISSVVRKQRFFELLPAQVDSWKNLTLDFLGWDGSTTGWRTLRECIELELRNTNPKPGSMVQLTWDKEYNDELGGRQRVQISVIYFRWRTEEFRKVSAGFLGILAAVNAVGKPVQSPSSQLWAEPRREQPIQVDTVTAKQIYEELAPLMRLKPTPPDQDSERFKGPKRFTSRQVRFRGEDGIWQSRDMK